MWNHRLRRVRIEIRNNSNTEKNRKDNNNGKNRNFARITAAEMVKEVIEVGVETQHQNLS